MIDDNDLYDISYVLMVIRMDVNHENNIMILDQIHQVLKKGCDKTYTDNIIRKKLVTVVDSSDLRYEFAFTYNYYVHRDFLYDEKIYALLTNCIEHVLDLLKNRKNEQAYDFVDAIHELPEILVYHHYRLPRGFDKVYIKPYEKKWHTNIRKR